MRYIITERQYNLISESKKYIDFFQELINDKLKYIRSSCKKNDNNDYLGNFEDECCDQAGMVKRIEVVESGWGVGNEYMKKMHIKIIIYYSSIHRGEMDADDLVYELQQLIRKTTGIFLFLKYESKNINKNFEW